MLYLMCLLLLSFCSFFSFCSLIFSVAVRVFLFGLFLWIFLVLFPVEQALLLFLEVVYIFVF